MERSVDPSRTQAVAGWITGGLFLGTIASTAVVFLALPASTRPWSALAMVGWVLLAGTLSARALSRASGNPFYPQLLSLLTAHGWLAMIFGAPAWGLMIGKPVETLVTMLFPVTLTDALRGLFGAQESGRQKLIRMLRTISWIAVAHLLYFFSRISPATRLFLVFLGVVGYLASREVRKLPQTSDSGSSA